MDLIEKELISIREEMVRSINELKSEMRGLIEINSRLSREIINIKKGSQNNSTQSVDMEGKIVVHIHNENIRVYGNTYQHRGIFGKLGGVWDGNDKQWILGSDKEEHLLDRLDGESIEYVIKK